MAILKTEFEHLFYKALAKGEAIPAQDDPLRGAFLRRMAQIYVEQHHGGLAGRQRSKVYKQTHQLLRLFSRIPPRHRLFLDSEAHFSERELMRVYGRSRAILERMGLDKDYEQRTRRGPRLRT